MTAPHHKPTPAWRRWSISIAALAIAATGAIAVAAAPAQASGSFCNTAISTPNSGYPTVNLIMPASSGWEGINCSMSHGATGGGVRALQQSLNRCYGESLSVDGQFGPRTQAALSRAQQQHGFTTGLGRYTDREAWNLYFMGISGPRLVCARMVGPVLQ
jgi:peptidoglycan hydrolase-like protein with peptidoglycan-binding domain